ncbi:Hypothetical predicted protein [Pelobates cultripes]|uniref:Uncharacterized protein n=1 Tax=Pelobates cultripes TaxID=61616 RepID=A0AAD1VZE7_PELCU|nr:Hypothetical predicted protein [Pelobates cultripes]
MERIDVQDVQTGTGSDARNRKEDVERIHDLVERKPHGPSQIYTSNCIHMPALTTNLWDLFTTLSTNESHPEFSYT